MCTFTHMHTNTYTITSTHTTQASSPGFTLASSYILPPPDILPSPLPSTPLANFLRLNPVNPLCPSSLVLIHPPVTSPGTRRPPPLLSLSSPLADLACSAFQSRMHLGIKPKCRFLRCTGTQHETLYLPSPPLDFDPCGYTLTYLCACT